MQFYIIIHMTTLSCTNWQVHTWINQSLRELAVLFFIYNTKIIISEILVLHVISCSIIFILALKTMNPSKRENVISQRTVNNWSINVYKGNTISKTNHDMVTFRYGHPFKLDNHAVCGGMLNKLYCLNCSLKTRLQQYNYIQNSYSA